MHILGINVYHPDVSAVLIRDGQLIAALEEERFRRVKHYAGFPSLAIKACRDAAGAKIKDVDYVATGKDSDATLSRKIQYALAHPDKILKSERAI